MNITFVTAFNDNYIWLLIDKAEQFVVCVDPGDAEPVLNYLQKQQLNLEAVLVTHHHADHCGGLPKLLKRYPQAKIFGPKDPRIPVDVTIINDTPAFSLRDYQFQILPIPGHTATHICFYDANAGLLFAGDTLFSAGCGRVFDGSLELLYHSLVQLKGLPDTTKVFSGHEYTRKNLRFAEKIEPDNRIIRDYAQELAKNPDRPSLPTTIDLEKQINPFLRLEEPSVIHYARQQGCQHLDPFSVFKQLRKDKDNF